MFFEGGSLFLWTKNPISLTINSVAIFTEDLIKINGFTLKYAHPISRSSSIMEGSIVITPTGGPGKADIEDIRVFAAAEISDEALEYYQNDVENNSGDIVLP
jgi:hypothetical protein